MSKTLRRQKPMGRRLVFVRDGKQYRSFKERTYCTCCRDVRIRL